MREWIVSEEELGVDGAYYSGKELIRCKDCKYFYRYFWGECECQFHEWYRAEPKENDYCSRGVRK